MNPMVYLEVVGKIAKELKKQTNTIVDICKILKKAREEGQQVFICGNGGSAGTANHMKADLFKLAKLKAISLNENMSLSTAIINDNGWEYLYTDQLERLFNTGDILITISVHGGSGKDKAGEWSQNILKAIKYVQSRRGITIGLTGFDGGAMRELCDYCLIVPADSTPLVESFHVVLHHLIAFTLHEGDRK